ncbi:hypothetical protein OB953_00410 [Aeromonas salmonicida]|uniref:hypothetical protein n=1 Tax=Aeromonas salmonicida TaxID=645 RepID=UPI00259DDEE6|nr:hypothetical protein [Aeromonas salmonicida]MDM5134073.1 hypothetical protein [Aeromonas salmonicida]
MSKESGGAPGGGGNHNGGVNGGGANSGSSSKGGGGSGKGGGKNDSNSKGSSGSNTNKVASSSASTGKGTPAGTSKSNTGTASKGSPASSQGVKGQSLASSGQESASSTSSKKGVASRVSSVGSTLSSYGSAPGYARAGYGDTLNSQRQQAEASKPGSSNHNISSIGGPSMYGMHDGSLTSKVKGVLGLGPSTNFNGTIKTDNVNGVIGNLQQKARNGTLTTRDKANIADASGAYNKQAGANIIGGTLLGGAGKAAAGLLGGIGNTDSYFSGIGREAASGDLDSERLTGQRGQALGSEGGLDSALKAGVGLLAGVMPGASQVLAGAAGGLTQPASGFGAVLNDLNEQAGNTIGTKGSSGNGSDKDYSAPPRQSLTGPTQSNGAPAFDSSYYDPSRFNVTAGQRRY